MLISNKWQKFKNEITKIKDQNSMMRKEKEETSLDYLDKLTLSSLTIKTLIIMEKRIGIK